VSLRVHQQKLLFGTSHTDDRGTEFAVQEKHKKSKKDDKRIKEAKKFLRQSMFLKCTGLHVSMLHS